MGNNKWQVDRIAQTTAAKGMISDEAPSHRWDLMLEPQTEGRRSSAEGKRQNNNPAYRWDLHGSFHGKASKKKRFIRRVKSDITDDRMNLLERAVRSKCSKEVEDLSHACRHEGKNSDSDDGDTESEKGVSGDTNEDQASVEKEMGYNWKLKRPMMLRSRSDITCHKADCTEKGQPSLPLPSKKRRRVHFTSEEPAYIDLPALTDEDKAILYFSKVEIKFFREDRDREAAERQLEKGKTRYADNSKNLDSIWGSSSKPKKKPDNSRTVDDKRKDEKKANEAKKEAEMNSVIDALQAAMSQAKLVTGY